MQVQGGGYDGLGRLTSAQPTTSSSTAHTFTVAITHDSGGVGVAGQYGAPVTIDTMCMFDTAK